ncbi:hypothetical protein ACXWN6_10250, partial [Streptococcus pyogenes]
TRAQEIAEHQSQHASDSPIQCPKCTHLFKIHFDPAKLAQAQEIAQARAQAIEASQEKIKTLQSEYVQAQNYLAALENAA